MKPIISAFRRKMGRHLSLLSSILSSCILFDVVEFLCQLFSCPSFWCSSCKTSHKNVLTHSAQLSSTLDLPGCQRRKTETLVLGSTCQSWLLKEKTKKKKFLMALCKSQVQKKKKPQHLWHDSFLLAVVDDNCHNSYADPFFFGGEIQTQGKDDRSWHLTVNAWKSRN